MGSCGGMGMKFPFCKIEKVLEMNSVTDVQQCECIKNVLKKKRFKTENKVGKLL